jgi:hypothetical protein
LKVELEKLDIERREKEARLSELKSEAETMERRLNRAVSLITGLSSNEIRWEQ